MQRRMSTFVFFIGLTLVLFTFTGYVQAQTPHISGVSPTALAEGMQVTITGTSFGTSPDTVSMGNRNGALVSWTDTQIVATVTAGTSPGNLKVIQMKTGFSRVQ